MCNVLVGMCVCVQVLLVHLVSHEEVRQVQRLDELEVALLGMYTLSRRLVGGEPVVAEVAVQLCV